MTSSMSHQRAKELLEASLHETLISFESAVLDHHLNNCPACRQYAQELLDFDHRLSQELQQRWPLPKIRQANIEGFVQSIQIQTKPKLFLAQAAAYLQPALALLAIALLTFSFIWALNNFAGQPANFDPSYNDGQTGSGAALETALYQVTDINCDGHLERLNLIRRDQGVYQPIVGISLEEVIDGSPHTVWKYFASQSMETEIHHLFLIEPNDQCQKLVGLIMGTGSTRLVIFKWDSDSWQEVLNLPGRPTSFSPDRFIIHLDKDNQLVITSTENINSAKCSNVNTNFIWNGESFDRTTTFHRPGVGCLDNR